MVTEDFGVEILFFPFTWPLYIKEYPFIVGVIILLIIGGFFYTRMNLSLRLQKTQEKENIESILKKINKENINKCSEAGLESLYLSYRFFRFFLCYMAACVILFYSLDLMIKLYFKII